MTEQFYDAVMMDAETLATSSKPLLLQLSAVPFNRTTGHIAPMARCFNAHFNWANEPRANLFEEDMETLKWWERQTLWPAMKNACAGGLAPSKIASLFVGWFRGVAYRTANASFPVTIWSYGSVADIVWVRNFLPVFHQPVPWSYRDERCFRTFCAEHPEVETVKPLVAHDALSDAAAQAETFLRIVGWTR